VPKTPTTATFEFTGPIAWKKITTSEPSLKLLNRKFDTIDTRPRLSVSLLNESILPVVNFPVIAVVYDTGGRAVGASKTIIESLPSNKESSAVFTWLAPFPGEVAVCEAPTDIMLLIDRSGSMNANGSNPPQPLTEVKRAAGAFADLLQKNDRGGLVSFSTQASNPLDLELTSDRIALKDAVSRISIASGGIQQTNIADAIAGARDELLSVRHTEGSRRVIVMLTDGVANYPKRDGNPTYGEQYALQIASDAKAKGIDLYTIGLGKDINETFLKQIASVPGNYYAAATAENLSAIYKEVATAICKKSSTAKIDIVPILFPGVNY
jgi:Mg-chelatase subunit ChlD